MIEERELRLRGKGEMERGNERWRDSRDREGERGRERKGKRTGDRSIDEENEKIERRKEDGREKK